MQKVVISLYSAIIFTCTFVHTKPTLVCIAGPSCSGKSTISKLLHEKNPSWALIEYDTIEENMGRHVSQELVFDQLITEINTALNQNTSVIVDTNTLHKDKMRALQCKATIVYFYIYAPLKTLLERDAQRTCILGRSNIQAQRAKKFVIDNFNTFYPDGIPVQSQCIDSHTLDTINAVDVIEKHLQPFNSSLKN